MRVAGNGERRNVDVAGWSGAGLTAERDIGGQLQCSAGDGYGACRQGTGCRTGRQNLQQTGGYCCSSAIGVGRGKGQHALPDLVSDPVPPMLPVPLMV